MKEMSERAASGLTRCASFGRAAVVSRERPTTSRSRSISSLLDRLSRAEILRMQFDDMPL